jgi:hypothetical protein
MNPKGPRNALPGDLPAQKHVLDRVEVRGKRQVLIDDFHAHRRRLLGARDRYALALEEQLARIQFEVACQRLDHR